MRSTHHKHAGVWCVERTLRLTTKVSRLKWIPAKAQELGVTVMDKEALLQWLNKPAYLSSVS